MFSPAVDDEDAIAGDWMSFVGETHQVDVGFDVDGATILSAMGGNSEDAGFMFSTNETTVLGFSLSGQSFSGCGTMVEVELDGEATGLSSIIISDQRYGCFN